jgi:small subunit ribosomal protein S28e
MIMAEEKENMPKGGAPRDKGKPGEKPQEAEEKTKGAVVYTKAFVSSVEEIIGRTGSRGEAIQVRCKVLEGRDSGKVLRRNVKGPLKIGDILMLRETEFEAKPLTKKGRGAGV